MHLGLNIGIVVDLSTKCHPELAREGIEYTWGIAKGLYHLARLSEKHRKEHFHKLVQRCLSTHPGPIRTSGCLTPVKYIFEIRFGYHV
jgi:hypothetical protein